MKSISRREFIIGLISVSALSMAGCGKMTNLIQAAESGAGGEKQDERPVSLRTVVPVTCDYVLAGGTIVDGTGGKPFKGDVAIKGDKIVAVGDFVPGSMAQIIDVSGLYVTPGFIDLHTHNELYLLRNGKADMFLLQGITSQIGGNCGTSVMSVGDYFSELGAVGINIGLFSGYKMLRRAVQPVNPHRITPKELEQLIKRLARDMENGAFGLSVGLQYWPQILATTDELVELCRVVGQYGGFYSTHIRNEEDTVIPSVEEAIEIGFKAGVPVQYSHIKTAQTRNWGKMEKVLEMVQAANSDGLDITADVYGYTFSGLDVWSDVKESINEDDMLLALDHPLVMIGSDSGVDTKGKGTHPRSYGSHSRILAKYVRDRGVISLEEAVRKMTSMPAGRLGLQDRGILREGDAADIAVFDLQAINDQATRANPNILATGVKHVFVNGRHAVKDGKVTGELGGVALKRDQTLTA